MEKICTKCKDKKDISKFYRDNLCKKDGRQTQCKDCKKILRDAWLKTDKGIKISRELQWKRQGIIFTVEQFDEMKSNQDDLCLICYSELSLLKSSWINVDHDHKTGKIRGIICRQCSVRLGWYESNRERINKYLQS